MLMRNGIEKYVIPCLDTESRIPQKNLDSGFRRNDEKMMNS
jgi:hypothetical protein